MQTSTPPAGCTGDCDAGTRDCTCSRAVIGMWDAERAHPWRAAALYLVALLLGVLSGYFRAGGGA